MRVTCAYLGHDMSTSFFVGKIWAMMLIDKIREIFYAHLKFPTQIQKHFALTALITYKFLIDSFEDFSLDRKINFRK